ncbi:hypothetical protein PIB30_049662 [Stylosanthes scabra]|uniref:Uncharacterized protein n=1 Tax=Stylosanthes scabra TaxID=79078 RepID=A0ABU6TJL4_9FABA|nr:hypothetical protein [Stylosanthes scabra]
MGRFGLDPRHLTGVNHTRGLSLSNRRVRENNRWMSSWPALGPGMHHSSTMHPVAPRPPRPAGSPSSSVSFGSSGSIHRERERSPCTPLPPPAPMLVPEPVHPIPRTPMMDTRHYRNLFPHRRVAPPTPPTPPPSNDEPSYDGGDVDPEEEGDPEDPYTVSDANLSSHDVSSAGASYGSERESASFSSGPSDRFSSDSSFGSGSVGYGSVTSGSASDASSDDVLVNRHFAGTYIPSALEV